jgi:hypothetical protein
MIRLLRIQLAMSKEVGHRLRASCGKTDDGPGICLIISGTDSCFYLFFRSSDTQGPRKVAFASLATHWVAQSCLGFLVPLSDAGTQALYILYV